jgi:hypothetical protein
MKNSFRKPLIAAAWLAILPGLLALHCDLIR